MPIADLPVRPLGPADLSACLELAAGRGWPRERRKWAILLETGRGFGVDAPDGGLAATAILTTTGPVATVSMVVVAQRYGRQGLGGRVMRHVLAAAGDAVVSLHATETGRPLYESMGFVLDGGCTDHRGRFDGDGGPVSRPIGPADVARVYELDAEAKGFARPQLLDRLLFEAEHVHVTGHGYALGTVHDGITMIGPVVAADEEQARALVRGVALAADGNLRLAVDDRAPALSAWCRDRGLAVHGPAPRLVLGGKPLPGKAGMRFSPYSQALG
ncbi:GNAT family N-acetyltransferase [Amycolatopsis jiangsuensis]|uniref:GNAT superfamily N-acetyltransferase n=1 Tax=Amycolatopsis jiangsuensis TaxID=1181879 RepID=A0A840IY97_9PSEU|nr:GNAT family N-acetyltransferase [Amycolatopsis jiangsuensis]MBB4686182.1 GNAT superfamily N-acetyltransferase [Amycolatopsis jiangsuensis]